MSVIIIIVVPLTFLSSISLLFLILHRFWTIKWFAVIIVTAALFFIPEGRYVAFSRSEWCRVAAVTYRYCAHIFLAAAMALGLLGSFFFIIIQVILLVDIAHRIANFLYIKVFSQFIVTFLKA